MARSVHGEDVWDAGEAYEPYVGRWSRSVAAAFLDWLALPARARWLDVGCGTGALSAAILDRAGPQKVVGADSAEPFVAYVRERLRHPHAEFQVAEAQALPFDDGAFDAAVAGLVLNFVPDPSRALSEMRRVVRPGGTVAAYVWDYAGDMQMMRHFWDAAGALDPAARDLDEGRRFPLCTAAALVKLFDEAGLKRIETRDIDIPTVFKDFDDYWSPFLGGQGPAPGYCVSLPEAKREALREKLRAELPRSADGTIRLKARALAVRGER